MKVFVCVLAFVAAALAAPGDSNLRIIGGHDAQLGQFPYQISLQNCILGQLCSHTCGATIISPSKAITAAHCYLSSPLYTYRAIVGINKLSVDTADRQVINVQSWAIHPDYVDNGSVGPHDIAVITLAQSIRYSTNVQAASLPARNANVNGNAILSGWGSISANNNMPDTLQTVTIPIITNTQCFNALTSLLPNTNIPLDFDGNICTGPLTGGVSACGGDSGGPLAQGNTLVGVVSWGISPCGSVGAPSVFVKVSHYIDWIQRQTSEVNDAVQLKLAYY